MNEAVVKEILRRWEILLINAKPRQISTGMSGSMVQFNTALCLIGYPFEKPLKWMDDDYLKPIMTREEFDSDTYDELLNALHELAYDRINFVNQKTPADFDAVRNNTLEYIGDRKSKKDQAEEEYNRQFDEWMKDFQTEPKRTREELEEAIKNRASRLERLQELKAPPIIVENEQRMLGELLTDLRKGNWAVTEDEIKYGKEWFARADAFEPFDESN
jgi:hypothetical protein